MIEFPLKWVIILAGAFLALAVGFGAILVYLLVQRGNNKSPEQKAEGTPSGTSLLDRIDDRLFNRVSKEPATIVAPPVQGEEGQNWLLLYRQPESEQLTLSLPGNQIVLKPDQLTELQLLKVKSMALGLEHWLGLTLKKTAEKPAALQGASLPPAMPVDMAAASSSPSVSPLLTRSIFPSRGTVEVKPMVSIAVQINAVLQNILLAENYAGPDLYLTDNPQGDLVVVLGIEKYIGIESVPDPVAAGFIKRAADRWSDQNLSKH